MRVQQLEISHAVNSLYTSCSSSSHHLSKFEKVNLCPPSPALVVGRAHKEDNAVEPMGKWSHSWAIEIWTGLFSVAPEECDSWEACSHFPSGWQLCPWTSCSVKLLATGRVTPLQCVCNYWVRLRRTGCHVQLQHCCFTRCRGTHCAWEHRHGDLFFSAEVEEDI